MFVRPRVTGANMSDPFMIMLDILSTYLIWGSSAHFKGHFVKAKINTHVGYIELYQTRYPALALHVHGLYVTPIPIN
jgi:hypothetical protein